MKKYIISIKIIVPVLALTLVAAAFASPAVRSWLRPAGKSSAVVTPAAKDGGYTVEDEKLLRDMLGVYAHLDSCKTFLVAGRFAATDPADSSRQMDAAFRFYKDGTQFYYRIGDNEMIALQDAYISINHTAKKIFIAPPKKVLPPFHMSTDSLLRLWKEDRYQLSATDTGDTRMLQLLCENHVTCKEYRFAYNRSKHVMQSYFMRLTDLSDPLNTALDKTVLVTINEWVEDNTPGDLLRRSRYVVRHQDNWKPAGVYRDYQLMGSF